MPPQHRAAILVACLLSVIIPLQAQDDRQQCYNSLKKAQRCLPPYGNVAFGREVGATNTCGSRERQQFCIQNPRNVTDVGCDNYCDLRYGREAHPPRYITDRNDNSRLTWWQSETMWEDVTTQPVDLTIDFQRPYIVYHIILSFHASSPDSFIIYKKRNSTSEWEPFQYYSRYCESDFQMEDVARSKRRLSGLDHNITCTSDGMGDPLQGGTVAFRPLESQGDNELADEATILSRESWLTAEQIKVSLRSLSTFGDDLLNNERSLRSYFYTVSDINVGARCQCHGHAKDCQRDPLVPGKRLCVCEHNTEGEQCERCRDLYNNRPWAPATAYNANECQKCNCNNRSHKCVFDRDLYEKTGDGGRCVDCSDNTAGANCEKCKENHYQNADGHCVPCNCNSKGSRTLQCDADGKCPCISGVGGDLCDQCLPNHYDFTVDGCKPCECDPAGSRHDPPVCDVYTGKCDCKTNVEGQKCNLCKHGFFNLDASNDRGCVACFCHGHSSNCTNDISYFKQVITSEFKRGPEKWSAEDDYGNPIQVRYEQSDRVISVDAKDFMVYFVAPESYIGDRRFSYNRYLNFTLRIDSEYGAYSSRDVIIEGADGVTLSAPIVANRQKPPNSLSTQYSMKLHQLYGWQPVLSAIEFIAALKDVRSIKIRGTFQKKGLGFLEKVSLESATNTISADSESELEKANWVESCICGDAYQGQFCEQCNDGFRRDPRNRRQGPYAKCEKCVCHGHSEGCDSETGRCICKHNTTGNNCEQCEKRFYGNPLIGKPDDCQPCPCPNQGECALLDGEVSCLDCPTGYKGKRCEQCANGFFGNPPTTPCKPCDCNGNIDLNSINYCSSVDGKCKKCIYSTAGDHCEVCKPGYFGNATSETKGDCKRCDCHIDGSKGSDVLTGTEGILECHMDHGQCQCQINVVGRRCERCREGYWNIASKRGCEHCGCNSIGSKDTNCDEATGKCSCRDGVQEPKCDKCKINHHSFSAEGCKPCNCDPSGSVHPQCDVETGKCECRTNFVGDTCNKCKRNTYYDQETCKNCDYCYNLVQDAVEDHEKKIQEISKMLDDVERDPNVEKSGDFDAKLLEVQSKAEDLWKDAKIAARSDTDLAKKLQNLLQRIKDIKDKLLLQETRVDEAKKKLVELGTVSASQIELLTKNKELFNRVRNYLDNDAQEALKEARGKSDRAASQSSTMQKISAEVRGHVDAIKKSVDSAMANAIEARKQSQIAFDLARETLDNHTKATDAIQELKKQQNDLRGMMTRVASTAKIAQEEATKAADIAVLELTEVNNKALPKDEDVEKIISRTRLLYTEASELSKQANELRNINDPYLKKAAEAILEAGEIVSETRRQQQITDKLLDRVSEAKLKAENAVKDGDEILTNAKTTLETLKNFDQTVAAHRNEATEMVKKIPLIEAKIVAVLEKSQQVKDLIAEAERKAQQSKETSAMALKTAEQAKNEMEAVKEELRAATNRKNDLKSENDNIEKNVKELSAHLDDFQSTIGEKRSQIEDVSSNVGRAKSIATETKQDATKSLTDVTSILNQLGKIDTYDENRLEELKRKLDLLEQNYNQTLISERTQKLQLEKENQNKIMNGYEDALAGLRADVKNIEDIKNTLPDDCFRNLNLEP